MTGQMIEIPVGSEKMAGYLATPASGKGPGIVLIQEIFGVNHAMKAAADDLAAQGYTVLAPDMFWRIEPGVSLQYTDEQRQKAFAYWQQFDDVQGAEDCKTALEFLKALPECTGEAGYLGFCLGGRLSVMAAKLGGAKSAVSYYGVKLDQILDQVKSLPCPLQIHVGDNDHHVPMDVIELLQKETADIDGVEIFLYPSGEHGFYNKMRPDVFIEDAWKLAQERADSLMKSALV